jgi:hypothetical protein
MTIDCRSLVDCCSKELVEQEHKDFSLECVKGETLTARTRTAQGKTPALKPVPEL